MKDSFVLFTELVDSVNDLNDSQAGALFKMILNYEAERELYEGIDEVAPESLVAFSFVRRQLDKMDERYQETVDKRKKAGQAGAIARWKKDADGCDSMANDGKRINRNADGCDSMAKMANTDTESDTESDNEYPTGTKKERSARFVPPTVDQVREYCNERGNGVDPETFVDFYASKGWKVGKQTMKDWKASVRTWEKRDNRGSPKQGFDSNAYLLGIIGGDG